MKKRIVAILLTLALVCACLPQLTLPAAAEQTGACGDGVTWTLNAASKMLTVSGSGAMTDFSDAAPWSAHAEQIETVVVQAGVTAVGSRAFQNCTALRSVTLPEGLTRIGARAFYGCTALTSIGIPASVTEIGSLALGGCASLTAIKVSAGSTAFQSANGVLYDKNGSTLIQFPAQKSGRFEISSTVLTVAPYAFESCAALTAVTIPENVTEIGFCAFYGCTGLKTVAIPKSVTKLGDYAFARCTGLTEITVASGNPLYKSTNGVLFDRSGNLLKQYPAGRAGAYTVPTQVSTICAYSFAGCKGLSAVTVPNSVTEIGAHAFQGCTGLQSLTLPSGLTKVADYAFDGCTGLTAIQLPEGVQSVGTSAFRDCAALQSAVLPASLETLSDCAFYRCTSLASVTMPACAKLGEWAFGGCRKLARIALPHGLTFIGASAFYGCTALQAAELPVGLTEIGAYAFANCAALSSIVIPEGVQRIEKNLFYGCAALTAVSLPATVTEIGASAFSNCASLPAIALPEGLTSLGAYAFYQCASLQSIRLPAGVTEIPDCAFAGCAALSAAELPEGLTQIGKWAFSGCTALAQIALPDSLTTIADCAFQGDAALASVRFGDSPALQTIAAYAFNGCGSLTAFEIPAGTASVGKRAFQNCTLLTALGVPGDACAIDADAATLGVPGTTTIYANAGSTARQYAEQNGYACSDFTLPSITADPTDQTAAEREPVVFSVAASGMALHYQWQRSNDGGVTWRNCTSAGAQTSVFRFQANRTFNGWRYRCKVSNTAGTVCSEPALMTVTPAGPEITVQPTAVHTQSGKTVQLKVEASGTDLSYQWQKSTNGGKTWGDCSSAAGKTAVFAFQASTTFNGWFYRCIVSDSVGSTTSDAVQLTVVSSAPVVTAQPAPLAVLPGEQVRFTVSADGSDLTWQWQRSNDGGATWRNCSSAGAQTAAFGFAASGTFNGWLYRCKVTNVGGSVCSEPARLTVSAALPPVVEQQPAPQSTALGGTVCFTVGAAGVDLTYQWQKSTNGGASWSNCSAAGSASRSFAFQPTLGLNGWYYRCVISNAYGSVTTEPARLTVTCAPFVLAGPDDASAPDGGKAYFSAAAEGAALSWRWQSSADGGKTWTDCTEASARTADYQFTARANQNGWRFRCLVSNDLGVVSTWAAKLTVAAAAKPSIVVNPASVKAAPQERVTFAVQAAGTSLRYQWQYSVDEGRTWADSDVSYGRMHSDTFTAGTDLNGRLIRCVVTNDLGRAVSASARLTVAKPSAPAVSRQPQAVVCAPGDSASFSVQASGGALSYQWQYSVDGAVWADCPEPTSGSATYRFRAAETMTGRSCRCKVTNAAGTAYSQAVTLTVSHLPKILRQPEDLYVAVGMDGALRVEASGTDLQYQWQKSTDGKTWTDCSSAASRQAVFRFTPPQSLNGMHYRCRVWNSYGSVTSNSVELFVHNAPGIAAQPSNCTVGAGESASFAISAVGSGLRYQWQKSTDGGKTWTNCSGSSAKTATLAFSAAASDNGSRYRCRVLNKSGYVFSAAVLLTVVS